MIKKALLATAAIVALLGVVAGALYLTNTVPPVAAISAAEAANPTKPYVVKLHAQWCPICMLTKGVWAEIEETYASRVNLLVLDFTDEASANASRAEAERLGLGQFFEEHAYWTGTIAVADGRSREATASIHGSRDFAEYRMAIDAALASTAR